MTNMPKCDRCDQPSTRVVWDLQFLGLDEDGWEEWKQVGERRHGCDEHEPIEVEFDIGGAEIVHWCWADECENVATNSAKNFTLLADGTKRPRGRRVRGCENHPAFSTTYGEDGLEISNESEE